MRHDLREARMLSRVPAGIKYYRFLPVSHSNDIINFHHIFFFPPLPNARLRLCIVHDIQGGGAKTITFKTIATHFIFEVLG